ncbi:hypothetical protein DSM104443_03139 [Usitatibacter rugosus]|uniref:BON domain-containing protein n=1 Tax=Usitatibacter rugosus TaxID=2732067 RepID=A0A6M4GXS4_9PROT|nr:BON domain-containing protein [Usitatibacter rugosus]QJR12056.1 hypothetical protein DSM104443_03139 [Usitatibacter rugosus]
MKTHLKIRNAALVAALAAVTATAYATNEYVSAHSDTVVAPTETVVTTTTTTTIEPVAPVESLTTNETVVTTPATPAESAPLLNVPSTPITIEDRRMTLDERIQSDVMDKLAASPNISGKIGVESKDAVVTLTGYTSTSAQAYRAGRYAGSVEGVKYVQNDVRGRIGGSY